DPPDATRREANPLASNAGVGETEVWPEDSAETVKDGSVHTAVVKKRTMFDDVEPGVEEIKASKRRNAIACLAAVAILSPVGISALMEPDSGPFADPKEKLPVTAEAMTPTESAQAKQALEAAHQVQGATPPASAPIAPKSAVEAPNAADQAK